MLFWSTSFNASTRWSDREWRERCGASAADAKALYLRLTANLIPDEMADLVA